MSVAIRGFVRGCRPLSEDFGNVSDVVKRTFVGPLGISINFNMGEAF